MGVLGLLLRRHRARRGVRCGDGVRGGEVVDIGEAAKVPQAHDRIPGSHTTPTDPVSGTDSRCFPGSAAIHAE